MAALQNDRRLDYLYGESARLRVLKDAALARMSLLANAPFMDPWGETDLNATYDAAAEEYDQLSDELSEVEDEIEMVEGACARATDRSLRVW